MRPARTALAALLSASLALGGPTLALPGVASANAPLKPINVKLGQAKDLTHIEFPGSDPVSSRRDGTDLVLRFARGSSPDLVQLKVLPPKFLKAAAITALPTGVELRLTPAEGAVFKQGKADGAAFVNLSAAPGAKPAEPAPSPKDQTPVRRADPVPAGGVVRMQPELQGKALAIKFAWRAPVGAAVFRRGDAIWMVFDAKARIDVSNAPHGLVQFRKMEAVNGADYAAVRILAPATTLASADAQGPVWILTLGPGIAAQLQGIALGRDDADGPATLTAQMAGSTGVFWVSDPAVGDKLAVVTALAPAKGLESRRAMVDAVLLPSAHGLAIQPIAEDLSVVADGDIVRIGRPRGLALSPVSAPMRRIAPTVQAELPVAASMPALIDFPGWSKTGEGGFERRYAQLLDAANEEGGKGKAAGVQARLGLARFLVGSELSYEAIGVLNLLAKSNPTMLGDAEFRGLRGAARAMAGRYHDAQADFSSPAVAEDPASALWRGYVDAKLGDFAGAREQFSHGRSALAQFAPEWKARFARMDAEAALAVGDLATARSQISVAAGEHVSQNEADAIKLDQGRVFEASNQADQALAFYDDAGKSAYGAVSAPALLRAVALRMATGKISPKDAAAALDSLRFRWRGDGTELETVRTLGHLYLSQGRYREALEALKSAGQRSLDQPASLTVANDLSSAFRALFLDGQADGMQPIQALALFFDFKELIPIGADGDLMLRKLVRRLVDVDLLDQAADLLKYQVDNRLNGVAKAQVSTDLATIYLMAKKPEQALQAINDSRSTLLPTALNMQRRVVEARALLALGRNDHALELLQGDKSTDAVEVRAEAEWKQRAWPQAGALLEGQLGDRWKNTAPLSGEEQGRLMRAGVAYSLAGDDAALTRLRTHYGKLAEASNAPDALRVALAGVQEDNLSAADFTRAASDAATFSGWVGAMKKRFHDQFAVAPPPAAASAPKLAKVATAPAPAKPAAKAVAKKS
jgi:tetratricopeptide (TPR) repeat protein